MEEYVVACAMDTLIDDDTIWIPRDRLLTDYYFVLRPERDTSAQAALVEYARSCEREDARTAMSIRKEIRRIRDHS